jgi:N-acetylmuramic acid 6-phosphate etherase
MKGGLAQKMILTALSTAVMVRMGRVRGHHMTHVSPVSSKLRARAVRILRELGAVDEAGAEALLRRTDGSIEQALALLDAERPAPSR